MTYNELAREYAWHRAECATIASLAQECGYPVTARIIETHLATWRDWFYGLADDDTLMTVTGVRPLIRQGGTRNVSQ